MLGAPKQEGRESLPGLLLFCLLAQTVRVDQAFLWLARRVQVSTTVSGFSEMLLMP